MPRSVLRRMTPFVHKLDHAVGRLQRDRDVLVELRTPVYRAVLGPIADLLSADPDLRVWFTSEYPDRIAPLVPAGRFLSHRAVEWRRFALYINGDPWAAARLRRCARRVNFFHGVAGKYDLDNPAGLPMGFESYDRVAFINRDRMTRYLDAGVVTPEQAVLIGYPKLDRLAAGGYDGARVRASLDLDPARPAVLYAPTYSPASSLHLAGEAIVRALARAGFSVIVKLHDRSLDGDPRYSGGIDWRGRFAALTAAEAGRVAFADVADASPLLAAADVMVTDHSSIGFEFLVLDRPVVVYDAPDLARAARINPEKVAMLRSVASVAASPAQAAELATAALAHPEALSAQRRAVARELFHDPGRATLRAVNLLRALLDRAPVPLPAESTLERELT
ncbi:MAG TPA: CDP-glycerol glycerophosphotransferase family protein [Vicinamibacterales bacterium]|nr:CDP-glycerol glycerophosphotransferase family protein [Vicinamibacterales bacterium]